MFGIILNLASISLLWWNEGNAVETYHALGAARNAVRGERWARGLGFFMVYGLGLGFQVPYTRVARFEPTVYVYNRDSPSRRISKGGYCL